MRRFLMGLMAVLLVLTIGGTVFAEPKMVLADTQQIQTNRNYRGGYSADRFEGKIVLTDIQGSKVSSKPWIAFYARAADGSSIKFELEMTSGITQVCALYKGDKKGLLDRKYLLSDNNAANDRISYNNPFSIEVVDGSAVIKLGEKSYTWKGVTALTGEMEVGRVGGKLEIYNYVRE